MKSVKALIFHVEAKSFGNEVPFPSGCLVQCHWREQAMTDVLQGFFGIYTPTLRLGLRFPLSDFMVLLLGYYRVWLS